MWIFLKFLDDIPYKKSKKKKKEIKKETYHFFSWKKKHVISSSSGSKEGETKFTTNYFFILQGGWPHHDDSSVITRNDLITVFREILFSPVQKRHDRRKHFSHACWTQLWQRIYLKLCQKPQVEKVKWS